MWDSRLGCPQLGEARPIAAVEISLRFALPRTSCAEYVSTPAGRKSAAIVSNRYIGRRRNQLVALSSAASKSKGRTVGYGYSEFLEDFLRDLRPGVAILAQQVFLHPGYPCLQHSASVRTRRFLVGSKACYFAYPMSPIKKGCCWRLSRHCRGESGATGIVMARITLIFKKLHSSRLHVCKAKINGRNPQPWQQSEAREAASYPQYYFDAIGVHPILGADSKRARTLVATSSRGRHQLHALEVPVQR